MNKIRIIQKVIDRKINIEEASGLLICSVRTVYRMIRTFKEKGPMGLIHGLKGKPSNHKGSETKYGNVADIFKANKRLRDFQPSKLKEYLEEHFEIHIPKETLRQIMIREGLWIPKPGKRKIKHQKRNRKNRYGELIQFDGSYHIRFENGEYRCLLVAIDDATSTIYAKFTKNEGLEDVLGFWNEYIQIYGKPNAIYLDQHATYKVNNPGDQWDKQYRTRFEKGMNRLGIEVIYAKTPEAKGRVERVNRTLQDWLVRKMRLLGIKNIEEGNTYLKEKYLNRHNKRFGVKAHDTGDCHIKTTDEEQENYYRYFSREDTRIWGRDGIVKYYGREFQLPKNLKIHGKNVIIRETIQGDVKLFDGMDELPFTEKILSV